MKSLLFVIVLFGASFNVSPQKAETVLIQKQNLELKHLKTGNSTYLVYFKRSATGPAQNLTLVKINVEPTVVDGRKAFAVTQQWYSADEQMHTAYTVHDAGDFSTIKHDTWWKRLDYTAKYDFTTKQVSFEGKIEDAAKNKIIDDFNNSFANYNLSWHSDLLIFPLFPFKEGRTFQVNFYDPGFGKAKIVDYKVAGSEFLSGSNGEKIDCWILEYKTTSPTGVASVQRFWISKKSREVLKEEDQYGSGYRYKFKIGVSGEK